MRRARFCALQEPFDRQSLNLSMVRKSGSRSDNNNSAVPRGAAEQTGRSEPLSARTKQARESLARPRPWRLGRLPRTRHPCRILTRQFPLIVDALARLRSRSCIIDGEAVACDEKTGIACFDRLRHHRVDETVFLYAFDLIELGGERREPLEVRVTVRPSSSMRARWGSRASSRSARTRSTAPAARQTGSR